MVNALVRPGSSLCLPNQGGKRTKQRLVEINQPVWRQGPYMGSDTRWMRFPPVIGARTYDFASLQSSSVDDPDKGSAARDWLHEADRDQNKKEHDYAQSTAQETQHHITGAF